MSQNSITPEQKTDAVTLGGMMKHVEKVMQRYTGEMIGIPNTSEAVYYTQAEADAYNALLTGALNSTDPLTAEQAAAYNEAITGAEKEAGDTLSESEANTYNATLEGAVSTSDVKTPAVPKKVKDYVDQGFVSGVSFDSTSGKIQQTKNGVTSDVCDVVTSGFRITQDDTNGIDTFTAVGQATITEDNTNGIDSFTF